MKILVLFMGLLAATLAGCELGTEEVFCSGITCSRHGVCIADSTGAHCQCDQGYAASGLECLPAGPCSPNPCTAPHQTVCSTDGTNATCSCDEGYVAGADGACVPFDPCQPNPCVEPRRNACHAVGNTAVCSCNPGYWDQGECVPAVTCTPNPCTEPNRSACTVDGVGEVFCGCDPGYVERNGECVLTDTVDDLGNSPSTAATLAAGATIAGAIDFQSDEDWFVITANAGVPLLFVVTATSRVNVLLYDAAILTNPQSSPLTTSIDTWGRYEVGWKSATDGPLYVRVRGFNWETPHYSVHVEEVVDEDGDVAARASVVTVGVPQTRALEYCGDEDWFTFTAPSSGIYKLNVQAAKSTTSSIFTSDILTNVFAQALDTDTSVSAVLSATLVGGRSYFIRVKGPEPYRLTSYTLTLVARGPDDHGDTILASTPLSIGQTSTGDIQFPEDEDWYFLQVVPGDVYEARFSANSLTLTLVGPDGTTALQSSGYYSHDPFRFGFWDEGPCYFGVRSSQGATGAFSFVVDRIARDTAGNSATSAATASPETLIPGAFDYPRDLDWYSLQLESSRIYELSLIPSSCPGTIKLYAVDGSTLLGTATAALSTEAVVLRRAAGSGAHYVQVSAGDSSGNCTGAYAFQVNDLGWDDHGDTATAATAFMAGTPQAGRVQFNGDVDWLSFSTTADHSYRVTVTPLGFTAQTRLIYLDGHSVLGDQQSYLPMVFQFSAVSTAPYFVNVSAALTNGLGSFTVDVEDLGQSR